MLYERFVTAVELLSSWRWRVHVQCRDVQKRDSARTEVIILKGVDAGYGLSRRLGPIFGSWPLALVSINQYYSCALFFFFRKNFFKKKHMTSKYIIIIYAHDLFVLMYLMVILLSRG